jgi:hypothetical protein
MRALIRLMTVPAEKRDVAWLMEGLQAAIELEMSTIPPYLYAAWSVDPGSQGADPGAPPADPSGVQGIIKTIAIEEMLHMGIACNMLVSIGGHPQILTRAPAYPARLPMNIHEGLSGRPEQSGRWPR